MSQTASWMERVPVALLEVDLGELSSGASDALASGLERVAIVASNARARELLAGGEARLPATLAEALAPRDHFPVQSRLLELVETRAPVRMVVAHAGADDSDQRLALEASPGDAPETRAVISLVAVPDQGAAHQRFVDTLSHDLQEPLRMVVSFAELLEKRQGGLDERSTMYLGYMVDGARRMQTMLGELLTLARVASRGKELLPTDPAAQLERATRRLESDIAACGALITHDPLPTVLADADQLVQVFGYLVHNSLMFRGADAPRIHVRAHTRGAECTLSVVDNGVGIAREQWAAVFTIFKQLHPRGEKPGLGCGTGLTIAKAIVERHGGRIWIESEAGRETAVRFTLRLAR